jgi:hypothetical protein
MNYIPSDVDIVPAVYKGKVVYFYGEWDFQYYFVAEREYIIKMRNLILFFFIKSLKI